MNNEDRDKHLYKYPGLDVLRNKFGIKDPEELERQERRFVQDRIHEGVPSGNFDLDHLQSIHHHLFQDVYDWAGDLRQVDIAKGGQWFHPASRINIGMEDVHRRLADQGFLKEKTPEDFGKGAGVIIGDVNLVHPFREGNGRTQFQYLKQLGQQAGHDIDLTRFERESWIEASIEANKAKYEKMQECIRHSINAPEREKTQLKGIDNQDVPQPEKAPVIDIEVEEPGIAPAQEDIQEPGIVSDHGFDKGRER